MTTIAWDGETLACDSQATMDDSVSYYANKIQKINGGCFAGCGSVQDLETLRLYLNDVIEKPEKELDVSVFAIVDGKFLEIESRLFPHVHKNPRKLRIATGSGWEWAQAALDFGYSAKEAVRYACKKDNTTGGMVHTITPKLNRR